MGVQLLVRGWWVGIEVGVRDVDEDRYGLLLLVGPRRDGYGVE